ncbi:MULTISPECIES: AAA family ATPase [Acinetobacter]|uniref:AAA family ATPase n=1 Tax=Acinetobacter TaxID=469 RepID=UPI00141A8C94|nr:MULTISPECIES: AAA family ATPase [Acinetobacter]MCS4298443.1 exonuclease SbcC [Acinetobacter guillouiae]MCW2252047.1 exonuclease SbcC [Acinetobacter sp. BIGb0204]NII38700.1 exonuclease SbcC [Acinetobacter sp. BIGb0196]
MKILSIRLKNLASLSGEHFIDFESEPLASAGLVAIIGKTGAGKSTILDAMCLALFNKIPRLKDSDGKLQDVDGSELLTNSPLTVLRRGTAHGFAELCFVAQDQKHYLARWELKRSREKADGKLQSVQRYLKCLTDETVVADKAKAVESAIYKITQLSFEQFTRAVLLAQSEVTAFLKARDNERGELLEYLTNSSIFGKVGQLAYEKTKLVASKRKELENLLGHIELLSEEDAAELHIQFQHINQDYKKLEDEKSQLEKQQQWFERKQKLNDEIVVKQQLLDTQLQTQQGLIPERERLNRLEIFSEIRSSLFQKQQLIKTEQQLAPQIQKQQQLFDALQVQFDTEKTRFLQTESALTVQQNFENTHRDSLSEVRKCIQERDFIGVEFKKIQTRLNDLESSKTPLLNQQQQLEHHIQQITEKRNILNQQLADTQQFSSLDKGLTAHVQQLTQFIQHYQSIENQLGNVSQAETKLIEQKTQLQDSIHQFGTAEQLETQLEQTRQQREFKLSQLNQLATLQQKLAQFFELKIESQQLNNQLNHCSAQFQQLEKTTIQAEQDAQTAKQARLKLQEVLQQQRLLHAENVEHLRAELVDGQACVVCGSTTHPYHLDDSAVSKVLFELQQQQEQQATLKEQETFNLWQAAQQDLTKLSVEQQQLKTTLQNVTEKINVIQQLCIEQGQSAQIPLNLTQTQSEIKQQLEQLTQQYQFDIQQLEAQSKQWIQSIKIQQQLTQSIQHTEHLLQNANNLHNQVQHIVSCLADREKNAWQQYSITTAQHILSQLNTRTQQLEQFESLSKQHDQYLQQLNTAQLNIANAAKQISETAHSLNEIKLKGQQNTELANRLIQSMTGLTEVKPNEWLTQYEHEYQKIQTLYQQQKQSFNQLRNQFEQEKSQLEQLNAQQQHNQNSLNQVNQDIQQWLTQHPDFQPDDLEHLAQITAVQEQQIRQQLQHAERMLNEANSALNTIQEQLTEHKLHQPEIDFEQLQQLILDNVNALKTQFEIRDQLKLKLELHQQNLAKQKQFADQIQQVQQEEHRWGKISGLMGDATGKKFRDYAQQYNLDILLEHANQQLAMLSQRYTLKRLDNSLSLAIIDHDMDGETRSVASLSGGESFLTALALSLAIANMASGSMKIESLFIDEGFGTLDASSLHMVMNALDQLQNQGRKVVLISHIQEMHERIPVQIQVRPLGAGASTIEVVS